MKQTIEIEVPEGYEVDAGEQPRKPENGDMFMGIDGEAYEYKTARPDDDRRLIILKNKAPEYFKGKYYEKLTDEFCYDVVEIKALEDALELVAVDDYSWAEDSEIYGETYKALKALVEG